MRTFISLHIEGTHQSWAESGVGFHKGTSAFPTRSGVIGLVAAAHGLLRDDPRVDLLHHNLRASCRVLRRGELHVDYQNIRLWESPSGQAPARPPKNFHEDYAQSTSVEATENRRVWRTYHTDTAFQVVLEVGEGSPFTAEQTIAALRRPAFPIYLGRKMCTPMFPLVGRATVPVKAESPVDVFGDVAEYVLLVRGPHYSDEGWMFRYPEAKHRITMLDLPPGVSPPTTGHCVPIEMGDAVTSNRTRSFASRVAHLWTLRSPDVQDLD